MTDDTNDSETRDEVQRATNDEMKRATNDEVRAVTDGGSEPTTGDRTSTATGDPEEPVRRTVKDIDHTHPHTNVPFGSSGVYDRGPEESGDPASDGGASGRVDDRDPVTDGGDPVGADGDPAADGGPDVGDGKTRRVRDRDHAPPAGVDPQRVFDRGGERPVDR